MPWVSHAALMTALLLPLLAIQLHLVPALLSGLLIYVLARSLVPTLERRLSSHVARLVSVSLFSLLLIGAMSLATFGISLFLHSNASSLPALLQKMAEILESSRAWLPTWATPYLPSDIHELQNHTATWLRDHADVL